MQRADRHVYQTTIGSIKVVVVRRETYGITQHMIRLFCSFDQGKTFSGTSTILYTHTTDAIEALARASRWIRKEEIRIFAS